MTVTIRKRERLSNGWVRYYGVVNGETKVQGQDIGVRLPASYVDAVSEAEADAEVREALASEYDRLSRGRGGVYAR